MGLYVHQISIAIKTILITAFLVIIIFNGHVTADYASITGTVADEETNEPVVNATVIVTFSENGTVVALTFTDSVGNFQLSDLLLNTYNVTIEAKGYYNKSMEIELEEEKSYELQIFLVPIPEGSDVIGFSSFICFQIGLIFTIVLIISLIMYSNINRRNLLKNAIRKVIFEFIKENPGKHYRAILNDLDLPMGVLSYHLDRLEKGQYIKSIHDGGFRRYYIKGSDTENQFYISNIQELILTVIKENLGISQSRIAELMGVSKKVINYHVNILDKGGLITVEKHGRESACYTIDRKRGG